MTITLGDNHTMFGYHIMLASHPLALRLYVYSHSLQFKNTDTISASLVKQGVTCGTP